MEDMRDLQIMSVLDIPTTNYSWTFCHKCFPGDLVFFWSFVQLEILNFKSLFVVFLEVCF